MKLTAHQEEIKQLWLNEIAQYVNDPLALHEHAIDDLRIDPTQVKSDIEGEVFKLPQRIAAYESDGTKPSEVAKDHYLPHIEKKLAQAEGKSLKAEEKSVKPEESSAKPAEKLVKPEEKSAKPEVKSAKPEAAKLEEKSVKSEQKSLQSADKASIKVESVSQLSKVSSFKETTVVQNSSEQTAVSVETSAQKKSTVTAVESNKSEVLHAHLTEQSKSVSLKEKTASNKAESKQIETPLVVQKDKVDLHAPDTTVTTKRIENNAKAEDRGNENIEVHQALIAIAKDPKQPHDADNQRTDNKANASTNTALNKSSSSQTNVNNQLAQHYQTISLFNFGDTRGDDNKPPRSNLPDFLLPPHLVTYETSFEIHIRKIPFPDPPPPPRYIKKLLVHTESLERKTRAFLTGSFEFGNTDKAIRTARQKIRSLKSTFITADDDARHAEDTIEKAKSGNFLHIFNPHLGVEKPQYEFIEVPSEEECSEHPDRRSERGISELSQDMAENYSSRYSSRSSRREKKVEGMNAFTISINVYVEVKVVRWLYFVIVIMFCMQIEGSMLSIGEPIKRIMFNVCLSVFSRSVL